MKKNHKEKHNSLKFLTIKNKFCVAGWIITSGERKQFFNFWNITTSWLVTYFLSNRARIDLMYCTLLTCKNVPCLVTCCWLVGIFIWVYHWFLLFCIRIGWFVWPLKCMGFLSFPFDKCLFIIFSLSLFNSNNNYSKSNI